MRIIFAILTAALVSWACVAQADPLRVQEAVGAFKIASPDVVKSTLREILPEVKKQFPGLPAIALTVFAGVAPFGVPGLWACDRLIRTQRKHGAALEAIALHLGRKSCGGHS